MSLIHVEHPIDHSNSRFEEVEDDKEEAVKPTKRPRESDIHGEDKVGKAEKKKLKAENGKAIPVETPSDQPKGEKKEKKKRDKKGERTAKDQKEKEEDKQKEQKNNQVPKKTIAGGIVIQDKVIGTGPMAKKGDTLKLRYVGKLTNGKVFDKNINAKPVRIS